MKKLVAIDCRMIRSSGIGTCLQGWLPEILDILPNWDFLLFGDPRVIGQFIWSKRSNVEVVSFLSPIYSIGEQIEWLKIRRSSPIDLFWCPHINFPLFWRGPLLITVHDLIFLALPDVFGLPKRIYAALFYLAIRWRANGVFFVSSFSSAEFRARIGIPRGVEKVIHNGVGEAWLTAPAQDRIQSGLDDSSYVVYVGNVKPHKNLGRLLQAFALIKERVPHRLKIIGRGNIDNADKNIKEAVSALGDRVVFLSDLSDAAVITTVSKAALLIQPSLYEGFGLTPLEAMAAGCPVASSTAGALQEVCGEAAAYFSPLDVPEMASTIERILTDEVARERLMSTGLARAREFTWRKAATEIAELMVVTMDRATES